MAIDYAMWVLFAAAPGCMGTYSKLRRQMADKVSYKQGRQLPSNTRLQEIMRQYSASFGKDAVYYAAPWLLIAGAIFGMTWGIVMLVVIRKHPF